MKKFVLSTLCLMISAFSVFAGAAFSHTAKLYAAPAAIEPPRVIVDTDLGSSMDDLFVVDFAARMQRAGKLNLTAVMMNRPDKSDPEGEGEFLAFADRYLASLGFDDLPLGTSMPLAEDCLPQHVFNPYWTLIYSNAMSGVSALMPTNRTDAQLASLENAVTLYRRLLEDAPDKSVVICSIGFLNNLKALMESGIDYGQDGIASTGLELIATKVKELRIMGGCFDPSSAPDGTNGAEYNFAGDPAAAKKVVEEWPTPVIVCPWEVGLVLDYTSDEVLADFPVGTPDPVLRAAYEHWPEPLGEDEMNRPWDLMTILPLIEGDTLVPLSGKGGIEVDENGVTTFMPNASSNRCYQIASAMDVAAVMTRFRAIFRTGNPSVTLLASGVPEPGVDYNGSEMVFRFKDICFGRFTEGDLQFSFAIDGAEYAPESSEWDEILEELSVRFAIPSDAVTAGNVYDGMLTVTLENDELGSVQLLTASRQLVQGVIVPDPSGEVVVNANLARVEGGDEYATVAEAVVAANGRPVRILHAASWRPTVEDIGMSVRFLNRSFLNLDESDLPMGTQAEWSDVEGDDGTLTLRREPYGWIYEIFEEICRVPRRSSHEAGIGDWLMSWAEKNGFDAERDTAGGNGNVLIDVPATPGMEQRALVILQAHQDMVPSVKEGVVHDWNADPVEPFIEDGWIQSWDHETSLGADDGIGIATALAIAEGGMAHGPLRLLFTVEEETTQAGVKGIDPAWVSDAEFLVNIDSEAEGEVTISSAINDLNRFTLMPTAVSATRDTALAVRVSGLYGGHSGIDINLGRHNAIIELASALTNLAQTVDFELISFLGGSAENAIPAFATAVIAVDSENETAVRAAAVALQSEIATDDDANAKVEVTAADLPANVLAEASRDNLLSLVTSLPNGVIRMSESVPGLVQTSSNLGLIDATTAGVSIVAALRSSSESDYAEQLATNAQLADDGGFSWTHEKNCEAWPADPESALLAICTNAYRTAFGTDMSIVAVHAGLECGTFKKKNPSLDMISLGPTIRDPHTVNERCELASCTKVWTLLEGILADIPGDVPVTPGVPVVFDTAEAASNAMANAVLAPSADVVKELSDSAARVRYAGSFGFVVNPTDGGKFAVEAVLTAEARTFLAGNVADVTRQIPVGTIAALAEDATFAVTATNGVPGFYYTLHDGAVFTGIVADVANRDVLCNANGKVVFPAVGKPSDAAGFFRVGVDATKENAK